MNPSFVKHLGLRRVTKSLMAVIVGLFPMTSIAAETNVPVTFSGGHELAKNDYGRPCALMAAGLGVKPDEFRKAFQIDRPTMAREWLVFANELEYGTDVKRTVIDFRTGRPLPAEGASVTVAADRGWQPSGVKLEAGKKYRLRAAGRYQIAASTDAGGTTTPWPCEPGGVTIRYYRGRPLGMLLAALEPDVPTTGELPGMCKPIAVGLETILTPERSAPFYFRVNDSNGELADNTGKLTVEITAVP